MGFSFSGAMRGLGAGLVNSSSLLEKQAAREYEAEQEMLKMDRQEHMERLRIQAQKEEGIANRQHTEVMTQKQIDNANVNAQRSYELDKEKLAIQKQEAADNAEIRKAQYSAMSEEAKMKRQAYLDSTPEAQRAEREKNAADLQGVIPEKALKVYVATGKMPELEAQGIKVGGEDVAAISVQASKEWSELDEDQKKTYMRSYGKKTEAEAKRAYVGESTADFILSAKGERPGREGEDNLSAVLQQAMEGDSGAYAKLQAMQKHAEQTGAPDSVKVKIADAISKVSGTMQGKKKSGVLGTPFELPGI